MHKKHKEAIKSASKDTWKLELIRKIFTWRTSTGGEGIASFLTCNRWGLEVGAKGSGRAGDWTETPGRSSHWAKTGGSGSGRGSGVAGWAVEGATVGSGKGSTASVVMVEGGVGEARRRPGVAVGAGAMAIAVSSVSIQLGEVRNRSRIYGVVFVFVFVFVFGTVTV